MTSEENYRADCPECNGERNCMIIGMTERNWNTGDVNYSIEWGTEYRLLKCKGCDTVFYQSKSWHSDDVDYDHDENGQTILYPAFRYDTYPGSLKHRPEWVEEISSVDYQLYLILNEMYQAYYNESYILASIGLRTAFDRTSEVLEILPSLGLFEKVKQLAEQGYIGETERSQLVIVTDAGSAAAHRAWSPSKSEFQSLLSITEDFIRRSILRDDSVMKIAGKIPARQKRKAAHDRKKTAPDLKLGIISSDQIE